MEYLNALPVIQVMIDYIEADDCISYIAQHKKYAEEMVVPFIKNL